MVFWSPFVARAEICFVYARILLSIEKISEYTKLSTQEIENLLK